MMRSTAATVNRQAARWRRPYPALNVWNFQATPLPQECRTLMTAKTSRASTSHALTAINRINSPRGIFSLGNSRTSSAFDRNEPCLLFSPSIPGPLFIPNLAKQTARILPLRKKSIAIRGHPATGARRCGNHSPRRTGRRARSRPPENEPGFLDPAFARHRFPRFSSQAVAPHPQRTSGAGCQGREWVAALTF